MLADGGNAVDAAVAANLVLTVVTPYHCGVGGDLVALVHDGSSHAVTSIGAAPQGATVDAIKAAVAAGHGSALTRPYRGGMPAAGALGVTVPGAVAGWFHLLERFGTRSFGTVASEAIRLAQEGFVVSAHGAQHVEQSRGLLGHRSDWTEAFGGMRANERFVQTDLAASLRSIADDGPQAMYDGPIGQRIIEVLAAQGSTMTASDFQQHQVLEPTPVHGTFRGRTVVELPAPSQGVTAVTALGILDRFSPSNDEALDQHLAIEACRLAYAERERHLADFGREATTPLPTEQTLDALAARIDPAASQQNLIANAMQGGTAYFAAMDDDGLAISLSQSNFMAFGSGVVATGTGIGMHNRGAHFTLEQGHPNEIAPGKRPLHTLIPALVVDNEKVAYVIGTMGGDAQVAVQVQLLASLLDRGTDVREAVSVPRWLVELGDDVVQIESRADASLRDGLTQRGHQLDLIGAYDHRAGHAQLIEVLDDGFIAAADPRAEGAASGW